MDFFTMPDEEFDAMLVRIESDGFEALLEEELNLFKKLKKRMWARMKYPRPKTRNMQFYKVVNAAYKAMKESNVGRYCSLKMRIEAGEQILREDFLYVKRVDQRIYCKNKNRVRGIGAATNGAGPRITGNAFGGAKH